jgi:hypothetical protein
MFSSEQADLGEISTACLQILQDDRIKGDLWVAKIIEGTEVSVDLN